MNPFGQDLTPIEVEIRTVYGKPLYYPTNDKARKLASIAKTETLTAETLKLATDIGLRVKFTHITPEEIAHL
jgi:hypothetical protein